MCILPTSVYPTYVRHVRYDETLRTFTMFLTINIQKYFCKDFVNMFVIACDSSVQTVFREQQD
jgi:hypothetical protein